VRNSYQKCEEDNISDYLYIVMLIKFAVLLYYCFGFYPSCLSVCVLRAPNFLLLVNTSRRVKNRVIFKTVI